MWSALRKIKVMGLKPKSPEDLSFLPLALTQSKYMYVYVCESLFVYV